MCKKDIRDGARTFQGTNWFLPPKEIACWQARQGGPSTFPNDGARTSWDETSAFLPCLACCSTFLLGLQARGIFGTSVDKLLHIFFENPFIESSTRSLNSNRVTLLIQTGPEAICTRGSTFTGRQVNFWLNNNSEVEITLLIGKAKAALVLDTGSVDPGSRQ